MSPLRARVEKGRLILDEATTLPEGTVIDLVADAEGDNLTDEERRALHAAVVGIVDISRSRSSSSGVGNPRRAAPSSVNLLVSTTSRV